MIPFLKNTGAALHLRAPAANARTKERAMPWRTFKKPGTPNQGVPG
jgi:hypothetical protein